MKMKRPALWAGMGRGVNNPVRSYDRDFFCTPAGHRKQPADNDPEPCAVCSHQRSAVSVPWPVRNNDVQIVSAEPENVLQEEEIMQKFCERFVLTQREGEVLAAILHSEENAQKIAEELNLSPCGIVPSYQQHKREDRDRIKDRAYTVLFFVGKRAPPWLKSIVWANDSGGA